jgi:MFS family permease
MLTNSSQCQIDGNVPMKGCPSSSSYYQPPLPTSSVEVDGTFYSPLTPEDIDCSDDIWSEEGSCGYEYCKKLANGQVQSGAVMSIPYVISACLSPILGGIVDKVGKRAIIATLAPLFLIIVHLMLGLTDINPIFPLVGQGLAYSGFAAVLWPSVPLVVEPQFIGLGYGVITSVQNAGLALFPLIVAAIYSADELYIPNVEFFFVGLAVIGFLVGIYLNIYDAKHGNIFNSAGGDTRSLEDRAISKDGRLKGGIKGIRGKRVSWEDSGGGIDDVSTINALLDEGRVKNFASKSITVNS